MSKATTPSDTKKAKLAAALKQNMARRKQPVSAKSEMPKPAPQSQTGMAR